MNSYVAGTNKGVKVVAQARYLAYHALPYVIVIETIPKKYKALFLLLIPGLRLSFLSMLNL